jgi:maltose alpha-D-glucosyltransferase/alpha-amylase
MPEPWFQNAVFYEIYIRAFADGDGDGHGDFRGLTARLDYLCELGVDCLWLMPMYPSPLLDDGYDIADYRNVHPDYGTLEDVRRLLDAAHARGLRVIADLVLNHTSDRHPWFQAARADRRSPYRDYYVWSDDDRRYAGARVIFLDTETSNWTWDARAGQYYWHRFYASQPDLNFDNPAVRAEMLDVARFWLDLGLDGFRADAVPYLFEREGTSCENLPETHVFLKELRRFVDRHYPGRVLLAEANQWPRDLRPYFGDGDEFHMAFHFPLMPRLFAALARERVAPVVDILAATPAIPDGCQWCTFLRNHDELTLEMVTPAERAFLWDTYAPEPRMRLNLGIRRRLAPLLDGDARRIALLHAALFSLPGAPILYYGDEIGMGDDIRLKDRDGVRTPMQWADAPNAGFSTTDVESLYARVIDDGPFNYEIINVAAQQRDPNSLLNTLKKMIVVRKAHRAFGRGTCEFLESENNSILAYVRRFDKETILVVNNLSASPQSASLWMSDQVGHVVSDLLTQTAFPPIELRYPVSLAPYQFLWLALN